MQLLIKVDFQDVSRILVIYTGGTIGMKYSLEKGYEPAYNYLSETLASIARFHDPAGKYEARKGRSRSISCNSPAQGSPISTPRNGEVENLNTRKGSGSSTCYLRWLLSPPSLYGKRMHYAIKEYSELLDSSNITMKDWIKMASDIEEHYQQFDAFIILHGTDTMAYTASALSFMLENLGKTVIITGSQVPISEVRNDAVENILGALTIAGHFVIPEVTLFFGNKLFRGNRCSKVSAIDFDAFDSPNLRPLVLAGVNIEVDWPEVLRPQAIHRFKVHKEMNPNVASLRLFPGITEITIKAFLNQGIEGVVLETYGSGNAPESPGLLLALKEASARGIVIVNCTQCRKGTVSDSYACSKGLFDANVVPGIDMTPECALTKLSYLLAKGFSAEEVRLLMKQNLRGELTGKLFVSSDNLESDGDAEALELKSPLFALVSEMSKLDIMSGVGQKTEGKEARLLLPLLMCSAAASNDVACFKHLQKIYKSQFQLNCSDYSRRSPIHIASSKGCYEAVEFLLRNGAILHILDQDGHTPLFHAVINHHPSVIKLLVDAGAHFNRTEIADATHEFLLSAAKGRFADLECFILAGLDINATDINKRTALHIAASYGHLQTVKFLCEVPDSNLDIMDRWGNTPLDNARATLAAKEHNKDLQSLVAYLESQLAAS
ncbi:hypothetical protein DSO57_1021849 [Entomophthora muscae]|uniref:Uncharacterized protein n=1 Tax=Entomophthora muscae TaxID=34485 RepID=A0ACC2S5G9_9FUNG|nr:hypothetical protein DSO57_1021849 [Entomophthora muscae]